MKLTPKQMLTSGPNNSWYQKNLPAQLILRKLLAYITTDTLRKVIHQDW